MRLYHWLLECGLFVRKSSFALFLQTRADKVADSGYSDRPDGCARGFRQNIAQTGTLHLLTENTDQSAQDIADSGAQTGQLEHMALHAENLHIGRINIFFFLFRVPRRGWRVHFRPAQRAGCLRLRQAGFPAPASETACSSSSGC